VPISFSFNPERGVFVSKWVGAISDLELLQSYEELLASDEFVPGFHEIADARAADLSGVSVGGFTQLTTMVERAVAGKTDGFKTAVVAPKDLSYGLARMYQALSDESPETVRVFREAAGVLEWLGVTGPLPEFDAD
jgi:hypothetical protein